MQSIISGSEASVARDDATTCRTAGEASFKQRRHDCSEQVTTCESGRPKAHLFVAVIQESVKNPLKNYIYSLAIVN